MTLQVSDRFKEMAIQAGLKDLLAKRYFDITKLDTLLESTHRKELMGSDTYSLLRGLHCVTWSDMGPELAAGTRAICCQALGVQQLVEDVAPSPANKFETVVTESIAKRIYRALT